MSEAARLWTGVLAPPLLWFTHLVVAYSLEPHVCEAKSDAVLWIATVVTLAIVAGIGLMARVMWRAMPEPHPTGAAGAPENEEVRSRARARFLAALGFGFSCLFALLIAAHVIPMLVLRPCD